MSQQCLTVRFEGTRFSFSAKFPIPIRCSDNFQTKFGGPYQTIHDFLRYFTYDGRFRSLALVLYWDIHECITPQDLGPQVEIPNVTIDKA